MAQEQTRDKNAREVAGDGVLGIVDRQAEYGNSSKT